MLSKLCAKYTHSDNEDNLDSTDVKKRQERQDQCPTTIEENSSSSAIRAARSTPLFPVSLPLSRMGSSELLHHGNHIAILFQMPRPDLEIMVGIP